MLHLRQKLRQEILAWIQWCRFSAKTNHDVSRYQVIHSALRARRQHSARSACSLGACLLVACQAAICPCLPQTTSTNDLPERADVKPTNSCCHSYGNQPELPDEDPREHRAHHYVRACAHKGDLHASHTVKEPCVRVADEAQRVERADGGQVRNGSMDCRSVVNTQHAPGKGQSAGAQDQGRGKSQAG